MVRVGPDRYEESLALPHVRPMDFTGKPLKGYVYVGPESYRTQPMVRSWVDKGMACVPPASPGPEQLRGREGLGRSGAGSG